MTDHQAKTKTILRQHLADQRFALLEQCLNDALGAALYGDRLNLDLHQELLRAVRSALRDEPVWNAIRAAGKSFE